MKPAIPDVIEAFAAYRARPENGAWGSLHVVLEDGNVRDDDVRHCRAYAERHGDTEGMRLAEILLRMSRTQRRRIAMLVEAT